MPGLLSPLSGKETHCIDTMTRLLIIFYFLGYLLNDLDHILNTIQDIFERIRIELQFSAALFACRLDFGD
jgi:hypothetical protein